MWQHPLVAVSETQADGMERRPDRVLPILNAWGLVGEIQIWQGELAELPLDDSHLLQNFASQTARAFERTQSLELEQKVNGSLPKTDTP